MAESCQIRNKDNVLIINSWNKEVSLYLKLWVRILVLYHINSLIKFLGFGLELF